MLITSWSKAYEHLGEPSAAYAEAFEQHADLQPANLTARIDLGSPIAFAGGKIDEAQEQADAVMAAQPEINLGRSRPAFRNCDSPRAGERRL